MLRAGGKTKDGRPVLVIGLEAGNIARLREGRPIKFDMAPLGITGECIIVFGETAEDCAALFTSMNADSQKGSA